MARTLMVCALCLAFPSLALAQRAVEPTETVIRLTLQPMAAPRPALKYQLLPELREMNPGNPVQAYMKCFAEQQNFFFNQMSVADRERYQVIPLNELPVKQLRNYGGNALRQADWAARLDAPDWQILLQAKREGVRLLLPDIQQLRMLAGALKVRFRAEVAEKRFDDALVTAKTMLALSRHLGQHPTLIGDLVGIAIAFVAIGPLEEMLGQPNCPNLYWSLTDLPNPLISLREGLQGERLMIETEFAGYDLGTPLSEDQLNKLAIRLHETVTLVTSTRIDMKTWLAKLLDGKQLELARQRVIQAGWDAERVKQFPPLQVVIVDGKLAFEERRDDTTKWAMVPYWQAERYLAGRPAADQPGAALFDAFQVNVLKVRKAQVRLQQRIAMLRHVEAIRMYAADHEGKLPAKLEDINLPLPADPFSGEPFRYSVENGIAELRGSPPRGEEKNAGYNVRYVISIKK